MITKRRYLDFEILKAKNEGFEVFCEGAGRVSFDCRSSFYRAFSACEKAYPTSEVAFRVGAIRPRGGKEWCVIYRPRKEAPGKANGLFEENGVVSETLTSEESYSAKRAAAVFFGCEDDERGR